MNSLSVLSKLFPTIVDVRLEEWLSNNRVLSRFQEGFVRNKSMIDSIFIIKTTGARYVRSIQGCIWWCLLDLQRLVTQ
jgi:hypothetical protein